MATRTKPVGQRLIRDDLFSEQARAPYPEAFIAGTLNNSSQGKVVKAAVDTAQLLKPAIRKALGR